jgi:hypothetical protein
MPHYNLWEPYPFAKVPDGPQTYILNILWLQKKAAQIHIPERSQGFTLTKIWAEVLSSAPHFLHNELSLSPFKWSCLLRVLCPVRRPVTTMDCILLTFRNLASYMLGWPHRYPPNTPFYIFFQQLYVLNFLNVLHTPFFPLQNVIYFIMLPVLVPVLFKLYIQGVLKFKCQIPVPKG